MPTGHSIVDIRDAFRGASFSNLKLLGSQGGEQPFKMGECDASDMTRLFMYEELGDLCIDLKATAQRISTAAQTSIDDLRDRAVQVVGAAEGLGLNMQSLTSALGFDVGSLSNLPSFLGDLLNAQVSAAVLKLSADKTFRGAHIGIRVGSWNHVVVVERAVGTVEGRQGCPQNGTLFLSISSSSTATYSLSDILGALGVNIDPGVGNSQFFNELQFTNLAAVVRGSMSNFGLVLSASVKYRDLDMTVVLTVAGLPTQPSAAIKLAVLNQDALQLLLSYIGISVDSVLPEVQIGNIHLVAATSQFRADHHCGLEDYIPMPNVVPAGLHFSVDIGWSSCDTHLCKAWKQVMPGSNELPSITRLQGGATMRGFTFNFGEADFDGHAAPTFGFQYSVSPRIAGTQSEFPRVPSINIQHNNVEITQHNFRDLGEMDAPNAIAQFLGAEPAEMHAQVKSHFLATLPANSVNRGSRTAFIQWITGTGVNLPGDLGMYCSAFTVTGQGVPTASAIVQAANLAPEPLHSESTRLAVEGGYCGTNTTCSAFQLQLWAVETGPSLEGGLRLYALGLGGRRPKTGGILLARGLMGKTWPAIRPPAEDVSTVSTSGNRRLLQVDPDAADPLTPVREEVHAFLIAQSSSISDQVVNWLDEQLNATIMAWVRRRLYVQAEETVDTSTAHIQLMMRAMAHGSEVSRSNTQTVGVSCLIPEPTNTALCAIEFTVNACASNEPCRTWVNDQITPVRNAIEKWLRETGAPTVLQHTGKLINSLLDRLVRAVIDRMQLQPPIRTHQTGTTEEGLIKDIDAMMLNLGLPKLGAGSEDLQVYLQMRGPLISRLQSVIESFSSSIETCRTSNVCRSAVNQVLLPIQAETRRILTEEASRLGITLKSAVETKLNNWITAAVDHMQLRAPTSNEAQEAATNLQIREKLKDWRNPFSGDWGFPNGLVDGLRERVGGVMTAVSDMTSQVADASRHAVQAIAHVGEQVATAVGGVVEEGRKLIERCFESILNPVRNMINDLMETTRQRVKNETRVVIDTNLAYAVGNITDQIRWVNVPWERIGRYLGLPPMPLTWSRCQGADLNLKEMIGFEFNDTQENDTCVGLIESTGTSTLTYPRLAPIFDLPDTSEVQTPSFLNVDLSTISLKAFVVKYRNNSATPHAVIQMTGPDISIEALGATMGVQEILVTFSTDGILQIGGVLYLEGNSNRIEMPCDIYMNWLPSQWRLPVISCDVPENFNLRTLLQIFDGDSLLNALNDLPSSAGQLSDIILDSFVHDFNCRDKLAGSSSPGKFESCQVTIGTSRLEIGESGNPFMVLTGPTPDVPLSVMVQIQHPFTSQMRLEYVLFDGKIELPQVQSSTNEQQLGFTVRAEYNATTKRFLAFAGIQSLQITNPLGVQGLTILPLNASVEIFKNGSKNVMILEGSATLDFSGLFGDWSNLLGPGAARVTGTLGFTWQTGRPFQVYARCNFPMPQVESGGAVLLQDWALELGPTNAAADPLRGVVTVLVGLATPFNIKAQVAYNPTAKLLSAQTQIGYSGGAGSSNCTSVFAGLEICQSTLTVELYSTRMVLKSFKFEGYFNMNPSANWGALADAMAPLQDLHVYFEIILRRMNYLFRLGIQINLHSATNAINVLSTAVFFEWEVGTIEFGFGGEVVMEAKCGSEESWPVFRASVVFQLPMMWLNFDADMIGCWRDAFGIRGLSICDVTLGLSLAPPPLILQRFIIGGSITLNLGSTHLSFTLMIAYNIADPTENALICAYNGNIGIEDVVAMVMSLASSATGGSGSRPNLPEIMTIYELRVSLAVSSMEYNGVYIPAGYSWRVNMTLFGLPIQAELTVDYTGFIATFGIGLIDVEGVFGVCGTPACNSGPSFTIEMRLFPPKFKLEAACFVRIFASQLGASLFVEFSPTGTLIANFTTTNINIGNLIFVKKSSHDTSDATGATCGFDGGSLRLWISGRIELLDPPIFAIDAWVEVTSSRMKMRIETTMNILSSLQLFFAIQVTASLPSSGGSPGGITLRMEAGNRAGQDMRQQLQEQTFARLQQWKEDGQAAINHASSAVQAADNELKRVDASLSQKIDRLQEKKDEIDRWFNCGGSELLLLQQQYNERKAERFKAWEVERESLMKKWYRMRKVNREKLLIARDRLHNKTAPHERPWLKDLGDVSDLGLHESDPLSLKEKEEESALEDVEMDATETALTAQGSRTKWGGIGKAVKAVGNAIHKHIIAPVVNAVCVGAREIAKAAVSVAQAAVHVARGFVAVARGALWTAQRALDGVLALHNAVYDIIMGVLSMLLGVTYAMVEFTLSPNFLDTCLSGELRYELHHTKLHLRGSICLRDLTRLVVDLFRKCWEWLTGQSRRSEEQMFETVQLEQAQQYRKHLDLMFRLREVENFPGLDNVEFEDKSTQVKPGQDSTSASYFN